MTEAVRILYVDDEPDIRMIVEFALEDEEGLELVLCASGAEALARVADYQPHLVLLDVMMPTMDGPTTLQQMKQMPELANTLFAFMTAKVQPQEVAQLKALGAVSVIAKPFDPMTLVDTVWQILKGESR
ncbi:response regulator [Agitococcus lubricus]|uniref:Response regulator receiver domain-containing protein n=1 Tax=Agitococcus lubricus TaxID=1077255 RepID=A0A2T5J4D1_9GAMM|nr:response regulator [Agitococcus lubricus]PTQ91363.1 response regulator receiver domain-containing protein [Agitococcus lubricus]